MLSHYQSFNRSRVSPVWLLMAFSLILLSLSYSPVLTPVQAQGNIDSVEYEDISFSYDTSLASNVRVETVAAQANPEVPIAPTHPEYIQFSFEDYPIEIFRDPDLSLFPVSEFAALGSHEAETIQYLERLLTERPSLHDVYSYPAYVPRNPPFPPYLPAIRNAGLGYFLKMDYIDFADGAGIRYIVGFVQNAAPMDSSPLHYTFQGLTNDGQHYVTANFFMTTDSYIDQPEPPAAGADVAAYDSYNQEIHAYNEELIQILEQEPASAYTPDLDVLDNVIRSLRTGATEPSEQTGDTHVQQHTPTGEIAYVHEGDIYLLDLATGDTEQLTDDGTNRDPAWMPDGEWLAFASNREGNYNIYMMRDDGSQQTRLTNEPGDENLPTFSSNGMLFFARTSVDSVYSIVQHDISDGELATYEAGFGPDHYPVDLDATSDDEVVFSFGISQGRDIEFVNVPAQTVSSAGIPRTILQNQYCPMDGGGLFSGQQASRTNSLAFVAQPNCDRAGNMGSSIFTMSMSPRENEAVRITSISAWVWNLDWSPDDQWLVFDRGEQEQITELYVVRAQGGEPQQISAVGSNPAWRPAVASEPTATPAPTEQPRDPAPTPEAAPEISLDQLVELPVPAIAQRFGPPDTTTTGQLDYGAYNCVPASATMIIQHLVSAHELSDVTSDYPSIRRLARRHQPNPNSGMWPQVVQTELPQLTNNQITAQLNYFEAEHWQESVARQIQAGYPILAVVHDWSLLDGNWAEENVHAFVITGIGDGKVVYNDPWDGQRHEMTIAGFENAWSYTTYSDESGNYAGYTFTVQANTEE
jgi:hypothetical protein